MFQLIVMPQGIEKVMIQLIDTPTKVYTIGAWLFLSKVPPRSASILGIDPINSHTSYFGESIGPNRRGVPISRNQTMPSKWNQRVHWLTAPQVR